MASFSLQDSNIKLKSGGSNHTVAAALEQLGSEGVEYEIVGDQIPTSWFGVKLHIQGIALRDKYALCTSTVEDGVIIRAEHSPDDHRQFTYRDSITTEGFKHPGGIQTIGSYIAVPVYTKEKRTQIQFYRFTGSKMKLVNQLPEEPDFNPLCAGITNYSRGDNEYYLLAASVNSKEIRFYRSTANKPLSDQNCKFEPFAIWNVDNLEQSEREKWGADKKWLGYPNSISLIADDEDNVYLMGLTRKSKRLFSFKELVDLYGLTFNENQNELTARIGLTKLASQRVKFKKGSFRWGGSARVVNESSFQVFSCQRAVWWDSPTENTQRIRVTILRASTAKDNQERVIA